MAGLASHSVILGPFFTPLAVSSKQGNDEGGANRLVIQRTGLERNEEVESETPALIPASLGSISLKQ